MALHEKHREWLAARGIGTAVADMFALDTREREGSKWLVLPYRMDGRVVNHKWRKTQQKDHRMDTGAPLILFNRDDMKGEEEVIITEGEWDTLAVKMLSPLLPCVSVPNGASDEISENPWEAKRYEWFQRDRDLIDAVKSFVLATDADAPGRFLAADLARLLGPERCKFVTYPPGCKDLNDVLMAHGPAGVQAVLDGAKPYPVKGLYSFDDFPEPPDIEMVPCGIPGLDEHFGLVLQSFAVITGWAGIGKTSLIMAMLAGLLRKGVPMAIASFETLPKPILQRRLRAAFYQTNFKDRRVYNPGEADEVFAEKLRIIANSGDDSDDLDLDQLIEAATIAVLRDGIRLLVVDPWNEIEHKRRRDESETEYVGRAIRKFKRFARDFNCAVWLVAHPTKPQDTTSSKPPSLYAIAGSANFVNKPDYGIIIHRPDVTLPQTEVYLRKVRMGYPGKLGRTTLVFDEWTNSYTEEAA